MLASTNTSAAQLDREAGDRRIWFRLVTPEPDRDRTITLPEGVRMDRFMRNPVFCWNHPISTKDGSEPPPAPPEAVIGRVVSYEQSAAALDILVDFAPEAVNPQAEVCYQMVRAGYLGAVSYCGPEMRREDRTYGEAGVIPTIVESELWEASLVIVPSNPGAQVLSRALSALAALRAADTPPPPAEPAAPRTSPAETTPSAKRGSMERDEFNSKLGLPGEGADRKVASKALDRYMDTTADGAEQRAMMRTAFEAHYPDGEGGAHKEPDGDEGAAAKAAEGEEKPADKEPEAKAADDLDKEEDPETLRAAVRMAQRAAAVRPAGAAGADAKIAAEVDEMIRDGRIERDPARRAEAITLHAKGKLLPALRAAGIKPGTFTTSQRLGSPRVGTPTEVATRSAGGAAVPSRKGSDVDADVKADAEALINRIHNVGADKYLPAAARPTGRK